MVMPFSRSRSIESSTWLVIWRASIVWVSSRSRSASVDLPWSTWAMIEKLRRRACGMMAMGPPEYSEGPRTASPAVPPSHGRRRLRGLWFRPSSDVRVRPLDGWFCPNCRSLNRDGVQRCYSCRARESDDAAGKWPAPAAGPSSRRGSSPTTGGARASAVAPSITFGDPDAPPPTPCSGPWRCRSSRCSWSWSSRWLPSLPAWPSPGPVARSTPAPPSAHPPTP